METTDPFSSYDAGPYFCELTSAPGHSGPAQQVRARIAAIGLAALRNPALPGARLYLSDVLAALQQADPAQAFLVNARLGGFTLPSILSVIAPPKFQHLGFFTTASGTVKLTWTGNASDLAADAHIALAAPAALPNGDAPVNGIVDVTYSGRTNSVLVRQLNAHTPGFKRSSLFPTSGNTTRRSRPSASGASSRSRSTGRPRFTAL